MKKQHWTRWNLGDCLGWLFCEYAFRLWDSSDDKSKTCDVIAGKAYHLGCYFYRLGTKNE